MSIPVNRFARRVGLEAPPLLAAFGRALSQRPADLAAMFADAAAPPGALTAEQSVWLAAYVEDVARESEAPGRFPPDEGEAHMSAARISDALSGLEELLEAALTKVREESNRVHSRRRELGLL